MLGLATVPSFSALEAALAGASSAAQEPLLRVAVPLTRLLAADVYHVASAELVEPEGDEAAQQRDLQAGAPIVTAQNWTHAAGAVFAGATTPFPQTPYLDRSGLMWLWCLRTAVSAHRATSKSWVICVHVCDADCVAG